MRKDTPPVRPILVSPAQAAEMLSVSVWSVHKLIRDGLVESGKQGGRRLVSVASLEDYARRLVTTADESA